LNGSWLFLLVGATEPVLCFIAPASVERQPSKAFTMLANAQRFEKATEKHAILLFSCAAARRLQLMQTH
jgi:hypothetical protein